VLINVGTSFNGAFVALIFGDVGAGRCVVGVAGCGMMWMSAICIIFFEIYMIK
jgi:hypothetical protein